MRRLAQVTVTMRELDRLKCIQAVVDGDLQPIRAAERLGLTSRQVRRLAMRYRVEGPAGLISRRRDRPSNNRLDSGLEEQVVRILRESYPDFGPTLAAEKLAARHQIVLAKETVRRLQISAGLWIPRRLRPPKVQQPRARRACIGELVQIDGCDHRWFEDRAPAGMHCARVRRRRDQPPDGRALHRSRVDICLLRGNARVHRALRQAAGFLQ